MAGLSESLSRIQRGLNAPKNQYNSFGKYHYRSCEDILEALKPWLEKEKCSVTLSDDLAMFDRRFYIKATATISGHGETISVAGFAREAETKKGMDDSQITGSASSYARKYALNGLFCIDDNKDADSKPPTSPANLEQINRINALAKQLDLTAADVCKVYKCSSIGNLTEDQAENAIQRLDKKLNDQMTKETTEQ